jgi:hypothetical protein
MSYSIWISAAVASLALATISGELGQRVTPHLQRLAELATRFFGPRGFARDSSGV